MPPTAADIFSPLPTIEAFLEQWLAGLPADRPVALRAAMQYAALGAGKRLRPVLAWHACVAAGGRGEDSLVGGCAVELVHAFSLVHDDLPALDNDDMRRGKPTLHKHAGEAMAILAGDQLLTDAFLLVAGDARVSDSATRVRLLHELAWATSGMISGQVYDTLGGTPEQLHALERVRMVHRNKTGALIRAACRMGAMAARANEQTLAALTAYGDAMGLMFQAVDDLIDVTQSSEVAGKRTGKDAEAGKLTYPSVLGVDGTREAVRHLHAAANAALAPLGEKAAMLRVAAAVMAEREK